MLVDADRPLIYAGQGVHYAEAWAELRELAELLEAPVTTSLQGKSAFPEDHRLSLGSGGRSLSGELHHFLQHADVIFGIGCSFAQTSYGISFPSGRTVIHSTLDPADLNNTVEVQHALVGDAQLTLRALIEGRPRARRQRRARTRRRGGGGDPEAPRRVDGQVAAIPR